MKNDFLSNGMVICLLPKKVTKLWLPLDDENDDDDDNDDDD